MIDWAGILTFANLLILVVGGLAGFVALRSSLAKSENKIKERIMSDLDKENEVLRNRVLRLEAENRRLGKLMQLIIVTLKRLHRIELDIDEDIITLRGPGGSVSRVSADQTQGA